MTKKVIGISSGRREKVSEKAVETILTAVGLEYDFYSLSDFEILTCDACNRCIETHKCIKDDRLEEIKSEVLEADGLVFGGPEYWDGLHAKGRAFWERFCFSLRHKDSFPLSGKPGVAVGVSGDGDSSGVLADINNFFADLRLDLIEEVEVQGEYACFTCGYGAECKTGGIAEIYDLPIELTADKEPTLDCQHPEKDVTRDILGELKQVGIKLAEKIEKN
jgi:hypothetical protein